MYFQPKKSICRTIWKPSSLKIIARFVTTLVTGVIKYLYVDSNQLMYAFLTGTFILTTLSKYSQISVLIPRFEVFLFNCRNWSGFSCIICRRIDKTFYKFRCSFRINFLRSTSSSYLLFDCFSNGAFECLLRTFFGCNFYQFWSCLMK